LDVHAPPVLLLEFAVSSERLLGVVETDRVLNKPLRKSVVDEKKVQERHGRIVPTVRNITTDSRLSQSSLRPQAGVAGIHSRGSYRLVCLTPRGPRGLRRA